MERLNEISCIKYLGQGSAPSKCLVSGIDGNEDDDSDDNDCVNTVVPAELCSISSAST